MIKRIAFVILLAGGILLITSSGAFSTTAAERSADVRVAGDANSLLQLTPYTDASGQQSELAAIVDGQLEISINANAITNAENVFNITNQGTQPVAVWITDIDHPGDPIEGHDENNTAIITFYNPAHGGAGSTENGVPSVESRKNAVELAPGETLVVSVFINTNLIESDEVDLLDAMIIHASADVDGVTSPTDGENDGEDDDDGDDNDDNDQGGPGDDDDRRPWGWWWWWN